MLIQMYYNRKLRFLLLIPCFSEAIGHFVDFRITYELFTYGHQKHAPSATTPAPEKEGFWKYLSKTWGNILYSNLYMVLACSIWISISNGSTFNWQYCGHMRLHRFEKVKYEIIVLCATLIFSSKVFLAVAQQIRP